MRSLLNTYDRGGVNPKHNLVGVDSSRGISHRYDYDYGNLVTQATTIIDDLKFSTSFQYTASKNIMHVTNPDQSSVSYSFYANSDRVQMSEILDASGTSKAFRRFSDFNNPFVRPLACDLGNGPAFVVDACG